MPAVIAVADATVPAVADATVPAVIAVADATVPEVIAGAMRRVRRVRGDGAWGDRSVRCGGDEKVSRRLIRRYMG